VGAKVNGKMVTLKHRLKSGDSVDIITSKTQTPSKDWLKIVKSSRAKTKIRQWLLKVERDKDRLLGEEIIEKALKPFDTNIKSLVKKAELAKVFDVFHIKTTEELFVHIGSGRNNVREFLELIPSIDVKKLDEGQEKKIESLYTKLQKTAKTTSNKDNAVIVDDLDDVVVRMGKCCNPIPGDPIVGFITRGRGITIHTSGCARIQENEQMRSIPVKWNSTYSFKHAVSIRVITHDKPGILSSISKNINNLGVNIKSAIARSMPDQKGSFVFEVEVKDFSEFIKVVSAIEAMEEVINVARA
jgi:GTP pyrophosphokinase